MTVIVGNSSTRSTTAVSSPPQADTSSEREQRLIKSNNNKTRTSSSITINNLMNQSTIYRRHEARLARSYKLRDDPRPAFIRVMSQLPIFNLVVPPYDQLDCDKPQSQRQKQQQHNRINGNEDLSSNGLSSSSLTSTAFHRLGDYSEDTIYTTVDALPPSTTSTSLPSSSLPMLSRVIIQPALQAMMATFASTVMLQYGLVATGLTTTTSRRYHAQSTSISSPSWFVSTATSASSSPAGAATTATSSSFRSPFPTSSVSSSSASPFGTTANLRSSIFSIAGSISMLFGIKVLVHEYLDRNYTPDPVYVGNQQNSSFTTPVTATSVVSSAIAGTSTGLIQLGRNIVQSPFLPTTPYLSKVVGRHAIASTLYFSIYEFCTTNHLHRSSSNNNSNGNVIQRKPKTSSIVVAGTIAGGVHTAILSSTAATTVTTTLSTATSRNAVRYCGGLTMWRQVIRTAPIHAAAFWGYETMKDAVHQAH